MRKSAIGVLLTLILVLVSAVPGLSAQEIKINVQGKPLVLNTKPVTENGRLLVPVRPIFEALGATVKWDSVSRTVYAQEDYFLVKVKVNDQFAEINGVTEKMEVPARIINDVVMVPARFAGEVFGATVEWNSKTSTVNIFYKKSAALEVDRTEEAVVLGQDVSIRSFTLLPGGSMFIEGLITAGDKSSGDKSTGAKAAPDKVVLYFYDIKKGTSEVASFVYNNFRMVAKPVLLPDGRLLAVSEKAAYTFDPGTIAWKELFAIDDKAYSIQVSSRGEVLYVLRENGQEDLYKTDLNGKATRLTNTPEADESRAQWSPNGKKLAFIAYPKNSRALPYISVINADGTGLVKFNFPVQSVSTIVWSPDGQYLAYDLREKDLSGIWTVKADGTGKKRILKWNGELFSITWSPDGSRLSAATGSGGFSVVGKDGTGLTAFKGGNAAWSPDGSMLLNERYGELWLWEAAGDKASLLINVKTGNAVWGAGQREIYTCAGNTIWKTILKARK